MLKFDIEDNQILTVSLKCFNDNIENIFDRLFELLKTLPTDTEINFTKNILISENIKNLEVNLEFYTLNLYDAFMIGKKSTFDLDAKIKEIEEQFKDFKNYYENDFLNSINGISLVMAGNIDKNLVERIHNKTISNFNIKK